MTVIRALAVAVAIGAGAIGVWRGTWAVGGSDSSCYALMAQAFARGTLQPTSWLAREAPWPQRTLTAAPGGFVPSPVREDAASPVCAPGFSLLLAPLYAVGGRDAIFLLTPIAGVLLVYLTYAFGRQLASEWAGLASSIVVATAPVLMFQIVQPMNDVAVAALWVAIVLVANRPQDHPAWLGALTGIALLIRPNLAPAAFVVAAWCLARGWRQLAWFAAAAAPALIALLSLNAALYGHPFRSGYGEVSELFALANVGVNVSHYGSALLQTQLGFPLLGIAALVTVPRPQRRVVLFVIGIVAAVVGVYVLYRPLPEWWYLRFLLPALPLLTVLAMTAIVNVSRGPWVALLATMVVVTYAVMSPGMREALNLAHLERRFRTAGVVARERLPQSAVFLTVWESGSVRYHAGRDAVVWDGLDPASLDSALEYLTSRGHEPYVMIEDWEEPLFRQRFSEHSVIGQLDWPPQFDLERRVKIYRPADRARYLRGEPVPTEFVRASRR